MELEPIGFVRSGFKEKFGIPRQAGLVQFARAEIYLSAKKYRDAVIGLEGFSHIWVIFSFHKATPGKTTIRPPRLGGAKKVGVFASRSPHRPNPIGLSAVKLEQVIQTGKEVRILISGSDLLDGTPVLDIKPYLRYADSIPRATQGWAETKRQHLRVSFSSKARLQCKQVDPTGERKLIPLIRGLIREDPRPPFQKADADYAFQLEEFDVHWSVQGQKAQVTELKAQNS